jgi:hypothetical protein
MSIIFMLLPSELLSSTDTGTLSGSSTCMYKLIEVVFPIRRTTKSIFSSKAFDFKDLTTFHFVFWKMKSSRMAPAYRYNR